MLGCASRTYFICGKIFTTDGRLSVRVQVALGCHRAGETARQLDSFVQVNGIMHENSFEYRVLNLYVHHSRFLGR